MSDNEKSFGSYVVKGTVLRAGEHISNGKKVTITPDIIRRMVENAEKPSPIFERHGSGNEIGRLMKLSHDGEYNQVDFESLITDTNTYNNSVVRGSDKISPDIRLDFDDQGNLVDAFLIGASLTDNPGMNFESVTARKLEFTKGESEGMTDNWTPPTSTEANVTEGESTSTEQPAVTNEQPAASPGFTADDVSKLVAEAVAKALADRDNEASKKLEAEQKQQELAGKIEQEENPVNKQLLEDYAKLIAERDQLADANQRALEQKYQDTLEHCRSVGIKNPESYVNKPNLKLTTEQKITLLDTIRANHAKTTTVNKPSEQSMSTSGSSPNQGSKMITDDMVAKYLKADTPEFKKMLAQLSIFKDHKFVGK